MEALVRQSALEWCILRGALFYGAGAGLEDEWRQAARHGELIVPGDGSDRISLIHVVDMARAVVAAVESAPPGSIYNVVDDEPPTYAICTRMLLPRKAWRRRQQVVRGCASRLRAAMPSSSASWAGSRRIRRIGRGWRGEVERARRFARAEASDRRHVPGTGERKRSHDVPGTFVVGPGRDVAVGGHGAGPTCGAAWGKGQAGTPAVRGSMKFSARKPGRKDTLFHYRGWQSGKRRDLGGKPSR